MQKKNANLRLSAKKKIIVYIVMYKENDNLLRMIIVEI